MRAAHWAPAGAKRARPSTPHPPVLSPLDRAPEPFDEGAAQVARLLARDRRELLGDGETVADFVAASEFADTGSAAAGAPASLPLAPPIPVSPFGTGTPFAPASRTGPAPPASPFGVGPSSASPFGGDAVTGRDAPGGGLFEEAAPMAADAGRPWWEGVTTAQVVVVISFTLIISLMLGTAALVFSVGAIHFNE
jgi:hypothetical protein